MQFWDTVDHFTPLEFTSPNEMDKHLIRLLDSIRDRADLPIYITSSYRAGDSGAHGEGKAVDISDNLEGNDISSRWRFKILRSIFGGYITRIGVYDRHIHIDTSKSRDKEVCWIGKSR